MARAKKPKDISTPKTTKTKADQVADRLSASVLRVPVIPDKDMLSTGCTLLNMAFSGRPIGGIPKGTYVYLVGDTGSSKTWATFSFLAEAACNPEFNGYRFVFDNAEHGALMDVRHFFGQRLLERLVPPTPKCIGSETTQQFYRNLALNCRRGPCIYVLDSMDAIDDEADEAKFEAELHYYETGKGANEIPGSMGMNKAKTNSKNINRVVRELRFNGSILIVISQTRDKANSRYPQKTRSGGRALSFYAHIEAWTSVRETLTGRYFGKERDVGSRIRIDVRKNRVSGWEGTIEIPFLKNYGLDDLGSCVDYLLDERHWKKTRAEKGKAKVRDTQEEEGNESATFEAPEFNFKGKKEALIHLIQTNNEEFELRKLVGEVWQKIIDAATPQRKARYT